MFGHASPLAGGGDGEADIAFGHLSDRIGREWVWMIANLGFVICCLALIGLRSTPTPMLLYVMVLAQGMLGYGLTSVMGSIPADLVRRRPDIRAAELAAMAQSAQIGIAEANLYPAFSNTRFSLLRPTAGHDRICCAWARSSDRDVAGARHSSEPESGSAAGFFCQHPPADGEG